MDRVVRRKCEERHTHRQPSEDVDGGYDITVFHGTVRHCEWGSIKMDIAFFFSSTIAISVSASEMQCFNYAFSSTEVCQPKAVSFIGRTL